MVQLEGLGQLKNQITSSGIEHATFWLLALYTVVSQKIEFLMVTAVRTSNPIRQHVLM
jgi:hypothetical protein